MKNVLVLEDNREINKVITSILVREGYNVFSSYNAFDALRDFDNNEIDCILTDLMLPIMSGEEFVQEIRKRSNVHIIIISAKTTDVDKIKGLKIGADDYLFKPFLEEEVILKIKNLFNKTTEIDNIKMHFNNNEVIFVEGKNQLEICNNVVNLTAVEYHIIHLLVLRKGGIVTREQFLDTLYSFRDEVFDRVVDVHIRNIRKKIKKVYNKELIKTVYGLGYSWAGI